MLSCLPPILRTKHLLFIINPPYLSWFIESPWTNGSCWLLTQCHSQKSKSVLSKSWNVLNANILTSSNCFLEIWKSFMRGVLFHMERLQTSRLTLTSLWPCPGGVLWPLLAFLVVSKILALAPMCIWLHLLISNLHFSLIPELSCCCSFPELIRLLVPSEWSGGPLKSPLSFLPLSCRHLLPWLANSQLNHLLIQS